MTDAEKAIIQELKKLNQWMEKLFRLFEKYDMQALLEMEEFRDNENKK